ncbi:hypothetical protein C450_09848 [Halococcus salifodinae DSM 8989]|uniref:Uncharacterized protein n=1 Tax=Halococcus salifodinae DSM 8989 TaxID=1227456 RepID=M0N4E8_9EURY|nr:hypothetical protein C450_09848 [Halococcus salifodinae DSM 8989]
MAAVPIGGARPARREPADETALGGPGLRSRVTQVCIVGASDVAVRYELLSRETAREALSTYDLHEPYANTLALDTVSLGAAVSLLNDLNWYLVRFASDALVLEPSISETEWLSRDLATAVRDERIAPDETGENCKIYGVSDDELVEPMYVVRTNGLPEYDLAEVDDTLVVRITNEEFGG